MEEEDFGSDSSDDDYVPLDHDAVSEEEDSGEEENFAVQDIEKEGGLGKLQTKRSKRKANDSTSGQRKRKGGIKLEEESGESKTKEDDYQKELAKKIEEEKNEKIADKEKKKADSLWDDFMKDVGGPKPKARPASGAVSGSSGTKIGVASSTAGFVKPGATKPTDKAKVTITKEFDFAGETVKVTKEVEAGSKEAKESVKPKEDAGLTKSVAGPSIGKRPGGLGSVLGKIDKKPTISTLNKSKIDWDNFKKKEGIEEELKTFNKGRQGYLERQDFLERTDLRQFEIEKNLRLASSSKR